MNPLPAPSTSRTPLPRLIDRIGPAATSNISGISTPNTSRSATPETATVPNSSRSDGLRIKGSASRHSRPNASVTVHLAPAAADSTASNVNSPPPDLVSDSAAARKRKSSPPTDSDSDEQGPLLSEYACPICFSPPKSAIITPCGHILCGSCLHGSVVAQSAPQPLCPVCRTPIPNLQFSLPPSVPAPNPTPAPAPQPPRRVPPPSRIIPGGFRLPTLGEDMVEVRRRHEGDVIDVDSDGPDQPGREREERWDPSRSGVVGLEILTMGRL